MALVLTALGKVKGRRIKTRQNKVIYAFKSIPYATPPVGDLRFSLPEPTEPWTGTLDCSAKESPSALQVNIMSPESKYLVGQEDCLYLNVFTPHLPGAGKRPIFAVIVWLHGECILIADRANG